MRKKQKMISKKKSQRSFRAFISIVKWYKNKFDVALYISNIPEINQTGLNFKLKSIY